MATIIWPHNTVEYRSVITCPTLYSHTNLPVVDVNGIMYKASPWQVILHQFDFPEQLLRYLIIEWELTVQHGVEDNS